jgi:small subunit ribosomal protein S3
LGHKVNPNGFRLGVIKGWDSRWYANRNYKDLVLEDYKLRQLIMKRLANASVSRIEIERVASTQISIAIHTAKPGIVIGKSGESVERLRQALEDITKQDGVAKKVRLSILEIRNPEVDAVLVGRSIAEQIEKRVSFRRAMKQAVQKAMRGGAKGIKIIIGGRLGGAEIARTEKEVEGSVPLQTLRANVDYGLAEAHTTFGVIGIKVWIYHGDILPERQRAEGLRAAETNVVPASERPSRGERGERGERGGRPRGDRGPRPGGDRGPRPSGERGPRPAGERGERPPRPPRPAGERGERPPRPAGERGPRQAGERPPRAPRAAAPTTPTAPTAEAAPATPPASAPEQQSAPRTENESAE